MEIEAVRVTLMQRMQRLRDRPVVWYMLATLLLIEQVEDILTTLAALRSGGVEGNPLAARLMHLGGWPLLIGAKPLLALALCGLLVAFAASPALRRSRVGAVALWGATAGVVVYALILLNNAAVWLVAAHALPWLSGR